MKDTKWMCPRCEAVIQYYDIEFDDGYQCSKCHGWFEPVSYNPLVFKEPAIPIQERETMRNIACGKVAQAKVDQLVADMNQLTGLCLEAFETNTTVLLSTVMRKLILEHAKKTDAELKEIGFCLCCDAPHIKDPV
jgi:hypothetical protein